jgi:hypothetical protein
MPEIIAQGDLLIERVRDIPTSGTIVLPVLDGVIVLAEGEVTGHRHTIQGGVTMFRDDNLAHDIPSSLYVGHVRVDSPLARLEHEEHAPLTLRQGTYRVRRQRELEPKDARVVAD